MSRSGIYAVNTTNGSTIANGGIYAPTTIVRRYGCNTQLAQNGIVLDGVGYYDVEATVTVTASAAGSVTAALYKDGTAVTGAFSTATVAADDVVTLPISALVRQTCGCQESVLTIVVLGQATTSYNLAFSVEKE